MEIGVISAVQQHGLVGVAHCHSGRVSAKGVTVVFESDMASSQVTYVPVSLRIPAAVSWPMVASSSWHIQDVQRDDLTIQMKEIWRTGRFS